MDALMHCAGAQPPDMVIECYLCKDVGCEKTFAVYERLKCEGTACQKLKGCGAITWLCEACALDINLRKSYAKKERVHVKRNFVCQCDKDSEASVTTFAVTMGGEDQQQRCFELSREDQYECEVDSLRVFADKPTQEQLMAYPGLLRVHALACLKRNTNGEVRSVLTFNARKHLQVHQKVSMQVLYDDTSERVLLVATTPVTTPQVERNGQFVTTKGARRTRSGRKSAKMGTSSDSAVCVDSDKNGDTVLPFGITMKKAAAGTPVDAEWGDDIELVFDGVLPPGSIGPLMAKLEDEDILDAVPNFCPISSFDSIHTNVDPYGDKEADVQRKQEFDEICVEHGGTVEVDFLQSRCVLTKVDTGKQRLFKSIHDSLRIYGFGERADTWDWHVVMLRRGRNFVVT